MTEFKKRGSGGGFGRKGGKPSFGSNRFEKTGFSKKNWGDRKSNDGPVVLHKAVCSECNKTCEVPFRPTGEKPVYCNNCFNPAGGSFRESKNNNHFPKRDFGSRDAYIPRSENGTSNNEAVSKQLEILNTKIEQLARSIEVLIQKGSENK